MNAATQSRPPALISAVQMDKLGAIRELFESHVAADTLDNYRLPVCDHRAQIIVGLSGGADSAVLALLAATYLAPHYPNIKYLFTDTKAEPDSCAKTLDALEHMLGITITRIIPESGLMERVDDYNGFLPGTRSRWCTRELKVDPLMAYMATIPLDHGFINLAGIRADEADREGIQFQYTMENTFAAFPFVDLGITKAMVFDILNRSVGIPSTYAYRSRSGCYSCFFQRNSEILGMLHADPANFARTEAKEKLSDSDSARWDHIPQPLSDAGIRGYYPVPAFVDIRSAERAPQPRPATSKRKADVATLDLFAGAEHTTEKHVDLFVAVALYVDDRLGWFGGREFTPGVYWQEFVTLSTSLAGLNTALGNYYSFKRSTPMPHTDIADLKIVIAQIQFPEGVIDSRPPSKDSYTWKSGVAYKQLRHLAKNAQAVLEHLDLVRQRRDAVKAFRSARNEDAFWDATEQVEALTARLDAAGKPAGEVVWEGLYVPAIVAEAAVQMQLLGVSADTVAKPPREGLEFDEVHRACISCSI